MKEAAPFKLLNNTNFVRGYDATKIKILSKFGLSPFHFRFSFIRRFPTWLNLGRKLLQNNYVKKGLIITSMNQTSASSL